MMTDYDQQTRAGSTTTDADNKSRVGKEERGAGGYEESWSK